MSLRSKAQIQTNLQFHCFIRVLWLTRVGGRLTDNPGPLGRTATSEGHNLEE